MSQITVSSELILRRESFLADLRSVQSEVSQIAQSIRANPIEIPVRVDDQFTPMVQRIARDVQGMRVDLEVRAEDLVTRRIDEIRAEAAENPIVVPVVFQPAGGAGPGTGAAGGGPGADAGGDEDGPGFTEGMLSRRGMMSAMIAIHGLQRVASEVEASEKGWSTDRDPMGQLRAKRTAIEHEHSGLRGATNWAYGKMGLEPTYDEEMQQLDEADRRNEETDRSQKENRQRITNVNKLRDLNDQMTKEVSESDEDPFTKRRTELDEALKKHNEAADKILDGWKNFGFKTYEEAQKAVDHLKDQANQIYSNDIAKVNLQEYAAQLAEARTIAGFNESKDEAEMRQGGQYRAASLRARNFAIDQRVQRLRDQAASDPDPAARARAARELPAAQDDAEQEKLANERTEQRREQDALARDYLAADRAKLAATPNDYVLRYGIFEEEYQHERAKMESGRERDSFDRTHDQEKESRDEMHKRDLRDLSERTLALNARGSGQAALASVLDLARETEDDLNKAGDDPAARHAALETGRARAQAMARSFYRPRTFSSWQSFAENLQSEAFSGTGGAIKELQALFAGMGKAEHTSSKEDSDKAFTDSVKSLNDAATKLTKSNVMILKDT